MANPLLGIPNLLVSQITDIYTRTNFQNLAQYFAAQNQLLNFKFFEVNFTKAQTNYLLAHGLGTIPQDVLISRVTGSGSVTFNYGLFDATNVNITASGPCRVRFFVGSYWNFATTVQNLKTDLMQIYASLTQSSTSTSSTGLFSNPMTTLGDVIAGGLNGLATRIAGNTGTTPKVFTSTGTGSASTLPSFQALTALFLGAQSSLWFQTAAGTYTFTTPTNSSTATVYGFLITAGGGAGGTTTTGYLATSGGGSGGSAFGTFTGIAPNTAITVTVGAGGVPTVSAGGATTIALPSNGPSVSGGGNGATDNYPSGTAGGLTAGTGYFPIPGGIGGYGQSVVGGTNAQQGGAGGATIFGGSGFGGTDQTGTGGTATSYGAGGGGGYLPHASGGPGYCGCAMILQLTP